MITGSRGLNAQLKREKFLKSNSLSSRVQFASRARKMNLLKRFSSCNQAFLSNLLLRKIFGDMLQKVVHGVAHQAPHLLLPDPFRERIHRDQPKGMKKVAGSLRLDLAAYRELEAFAQLGTDLDAATQGQLDRGARMVELLKQGQYVPMPVTAQIISIYAGTQGLLDPVPLERIREVEQVFLTEIEQSHHELWDAITEAKAIDGENASRLDAVLKDIIDGFLAGK